MASKLPIQINNLRFSVNPTGLTITKAVSHQPIHTQRGVIYQVWYDAPEVLTITGESAGSSAFQELQFLKQNFERRDKVSELFYKTRLYRGFITDVSVTASTGHVNRFLYSITFQLLFGEQFAFEDFSVRPEDTGIIGDTLRRLDRSINKRLDKADTWLQKQGLSILPDSFRQDRGL